MNLVDSYGRRINYLRLSVTDRCNLRCRYCMPANGVRKLAHDRMMSYEELLRVATTAVELGIEKIRLTGGEPLVRRGIVSFIERLSQIEGLKELVLTTNGVFLKEMAKDLRRAGVQRLNVSLDSLKPDVFAEVTRGGDLRQVLDGLAAAEEAGFPAPKINMVVMRGVNDAELLDFAALTLEKAYVVRFIEYMPTNGREGWGASCMTGPEILERIGRRYQLLPLVGNELAGPAVNYKIGGAAGSLGIITPISGHFCASCNRIRVTASGVARGCLFSGEGTDLKPLLRPLNAERLTQALSDIIIGKPGGHQLSEAGVETSPFAMSQIGG